MIISKQTAAYQDLHFNLMMEFINEIYVQYVHTQPKDSRHKVGNVWRYEDVSP